jgi:hypothetical protein
VGGWGGGFLPAFRFLGRLDLAVPRGVLSVHGCWGFLLQSVFLRVRIRGNRWGGTGVKCLDSRRRFARHELVTNNGTVSDVGVRVDSPAMCLCSCRKIGAFLRMRSV